MKLAVLLLRPVLSAIFDFRHKMSSGTVDIGAVVFCTAENIYFRFATNRSSVKLAELLLLPVLSAILYLRNKKASAKSHSVD